MLILAGFDHWGNVISSAMTGAETFRAGFRLQVSPTFVANGGVHDL